MKCKKWNRPSKLTIELVQTVLASDVCDSVISKPCASHPPSTIHPPPSTIHLLPSTFHQDPTNPRSGHFRVHNEVTKKKLFEYKVHSDDMRICIPSCQFQSITKLSATAWSKKRQTLNKYLNTQIYTCSVLTIFKLFKTVLLNPVICCPQNFNYREEISFIAWVHKV